MLKGTRERTNADLNMASDTSTIVDLDTYESIYNNFFLRAMRYSFVFSTILLLSPCAKAAFVTGPRMPHRRQANAQQLNSLMIPHDMVNAMPTHHGSVVSSLLQSYSSLLRANPVTTKSITAAILASTGDFVAQYQSNRNENKSFEYDSKRGAAFLLFGAMYTGLFQHFWFDFLNNHILDWGENIGIWGHPAEKRIEIMNFIQKEDWWEYFDIRAQIEDIFSRLQDPPSDATLAAAKVVLNQFVVVPTFYMPLFFAVTGAMGGLDFKKIVARAQALFVPLIRRSYLFWLPTQFFQFLVVSPEWQIPFVCCASLCWTVILSSIGGSTTPAASPSNIVVYETSFAIDQEGERVVTVMPVNAGAVNRATDAVLLEDVTNALVPDSVSDAVEAVSDAVEVAFSNIENATSALVPDVISDAVEDALNNPQVGASAKGMAVGLLTSATDEASIGAAIGSMLGEAGTGTGVALAAAVGAGVGYLAGSSDDAPEPAAVTEGADDDPYEDANGSFMLSVNDGTNSTMSQTERNLAPTMLYARKDRKS